MKKCPLTVYTASHFLVDLACGYTLYSMYAEGKIEAASVAVLFILYNMLAFATQHLFGALADKVNSNGSTFAFIGILATAAGVLIRGAAPAVSVCFVGLGNACFHVGGGIDALTESQGFTRAGIFVSSGALGIALGCRFGQSLLFPPALYVLALALAALAVAIFCRGERTVIPEEEAPQTRISSSTLAICILIFAVVIRSYAGFAATKPTEVFPLFTLAVAASAFAGKLLGGVFADLFGARRVGTLSLLLCVPLYYFGAGSVVLFLTATFFFNIAMPITLVGAARKLRSHEGFVFGLTTVALFIGYFVHTLFPIGRALSVILIPILSLVAAVCVFLTTDDIRERK
ncbi:MAG: hypothetical protein IIX44_00310 [Clostridia bacterium]|nr:hypothetical protein [Clostridia bacterium]